MISVMRLKTQFYSAFRLMIEGAYIDVVYKRKIYRLSLEEVGDYVRPPKKKRSSLKKYIVRSRCKECGALELNGVCTSIHVSNTDGDGNNPEK